MTEIERLKIKCNQYAKRLVNLGEDDVVWEGSNDAPKNTAPNSDYAKSCETCIYGVDGCQHDPPCETGTGKPYYKKLDFA